MNNKLWKVELVLELDGGWSPDFILAWIDESLEPDEKLLKYRFTQINSLEEIEND